MHVSIGLYIAIVVLGLSFIIVRGYKAQEMAGVSKGGWPYLRPDVSYLASQTLPAGHRVGEQDLLPPDISPNLASALPDKQRLLGKYVVGAIPSGAPVSEDSLSRSPIAEEVPLGWRRLRVPVDRSILNRINAGVHVWLTWGDTLVAQADVEHLLCQGETCDAHLLIDSAAVSHLLQTGTRIPRLGIVLPINDDLP